MRSKKRRKSPQTSTQPNTAPHHHLNCCNCRHLPQSTTATTTQPNTINPFTVSERCLAKTARLTNILQLVFISSILLFVDTHYFSKQANCQRVLPELVNTYISNQIEFNNRQQASSGFVQPAAAVDLIAQHGGLVSDKNLTLSRQSNPILITKDIIIRKNAKLTIEPGVEMLFEKNKGIVVYGTLEALGSKYDRIKLSLLKSTQTATVNPRSQTSNNIPRASVRLVEGDLPNEGRVQIKLNGRWHSLCTNSRNLTAADMRVMCRQVGYQDGHLYKWFAKRNESLQVMSKSFNCSGFEMSLSLCQRWSHIRTGNGVCDFHSDIGIRCSKTLATVNPETPGSYGFWKGIEFVNSETANEYDLDGKMKRKMSKSRLEHLTITYAGVNEVGNATGAIKVTGQPPIISNIDISNSIYGIFIQDADDAIEMSNVKLVDNWNAPLFVNSSWGQVKLDSMFIENNGGDGVRVVRHEKMVVGSQDFCKFANLGKSQSYPVVLSHEQTFFTVGRECCQEFVSDNQLTIHFPVLRSTPNNVLVENDESKRILVPQGVTLGKDALLLIYDDYRDENPFKLHVRNGTRAQSIVSRSGRLKVCYEPAMYRTVLFTVEIVLEEDDEWTGRAVDLEIYNSFIKSNDGRGVLVQNQRSGVKIINTTIVQHNYVSGVHFENGTGEVIVQASKISNNIGHGILINLAGGYYHIDNSTITDNFLTGLTIDYDKRFELEPFNHTVHVSYSLISKNTEDGIRIGSLCQHDAFYNISMNSLTKNGRDALSFQSCLPSLENLMIFKQNSSRVIETDANDDLRSSIFVHNMYQELYITHNTFASNQRRAIFMSPVFFLKSFIRHNLFREQPLAVIYISNLNYPDIEANPVALQSPVSIRISSNRFYENRGRFVANIGVQEDNPKQTLTFTKNFLENNHITEPYLDLKPRSRVSAVVIISSSNAKAIRNRFINPSSIFDFGTHLESHSKVINATANFWGFGLDASSIYKRIFDRKNRYNLAQIEFLQYLKTPEDLEYATDMSFERDRDKISTFKDGIRLGGEVKGYEELAADTYIVQDDIFVRPGAHLIIRPGTVLKFADTVGMMVQGQIHATGANQLPITMTSVVATNRMPQRLVQTTTPSPQFGAWVSNEAEKAPASDDRNAESMIESTINLNNSLLRPHLTHRSMRQTGPSSAQNVRLSYVTMGRLEVLVDGVWGSVCDYNFDIDDAGVACQQLGMILNKDDWHLERFQFVPNDNPHQAPFLANNVLITNLQCDPSLDTDITKCKAEYNYRNDFDGTCQSEVGIRCFPPSWSGVRLGMGAETSYLEHVSIQRAGLFDYATFSLKPALQIDINKHRISSITVKSNSGSGVGIIWNDVIGKHFHELKLSDSKFHNNERHGLELRSKGITLKNCSFNNNRQSGIDYNPVLDHKERLDLISWLETPETTASVIHISFPLKNNHFIIPPSEDSYRYVIFQRNPPENVKEVITIATDPGHMLSIMLFNPIHPRSTERLTMTTSKNLDALVWEFKTNMTSFPMVSPGYKFTFNYTSGKHPKGNMVLYIRSRYSNRDSKALAKHIPLHLIMSNFEQTAMNLNAKLLNSLVIANCNVTKNGRGLTFRHYNSFFNSFDGFNLRYANETTNITSTLIDNNFYTSIFVGGNQCEPLDSNYTHPDFTSSPSEIYYNLINSRVRRNRDGIKQFSRDNRNSFNVYHWTINETSFELNKDGGISLVLPYYWRYDLNMSHTVSINNNSFTRNNHFELEFDGHFAILNMTGNLIRDNRCKNDLLHFSGMEKLMTISYNSIDYNVCNRIIEFSSQSHADNLGYVPASLEYNSIRYNRRINGTFIIDTLSEHRSVGASGRLKLVSKLQSQMNEFALSVRGVQILNITRNLFFNPDLRFEFVAGVQLDPNESAFNASENYWGSANQLEIKDRIFDYDDWNNYAAVDISPYLLQESFTSASVSADTSEPSSYLTNKPLGGRVFKHMNMAYRKEPYLVESDLTIMPNARLTIDRGVVIEFMPHVGILVLGELVAAGTEELPIIMKPALTSQDILSLYKDLSPFKLQTIPSKLLLHPDPLSSEQNYIFKHSQSAYPIDMGSLRLCKNEICNDGSHIYDNNIEDPSLRQEVLRTSNTTWKMDGFLEIFNMTTLQWVPICDSRFSESTAKVICRQFGYSNLALFKRGFRYTIEQEAISSVRHWPESLDCNGGEYNLANCTMRFTDSTNASTECTKEGNQFIYVHCQDFPYDDFQQNTNHSLTDENVNFWGGVRFACPYSSYHQASHLSQELRDPFNLAAVPNQLVKSRLNYVLIDRAGMLHRKKSPALQILHCDLQVEYMTVQNSAHHGIELITSQGNQNFHQLRLRNNMGLGFNYITLTGSSSSSKVLPYLPLKQLDLSPDIPGLFDICSANKEIKIDDRVLLIYRYNSQPVDCIKIISSKHNIKHIGLRMLQFNLFNASMSTNISDFIRIYDGNIFDRDSRLITEFGVTDQHKHDRPEMKSYQTTDSTMTVKLHSTGASYVHGFVAEIVTTPVTNNLQRDSYNNITFSDMVNNKLGAFEVHSAGESSPNLVFSNNRIDKNCLHLFGNFTSCFTPIYMELQNCQKLKLTNNLIRNNQGGLTIKSYSHTAVSALDALIENNVLEANLNSNTMTILGPRSDPHQTVRIGRNLITRNHAQYSSNIVLSRTVTNLSYNIMSNNIGKHQIEVLGFDKLPLSYQSFKHNWIYGNKATTLRDKSTIIGNSAGQHYYMNYLVNPDNHFELSTMNWSRYDVKPFYVPRDDEIIHLASGDGSYKDLFRKTAESIPLNIVDVKKLNLYQAPLNARYNWWGFNTTSAIQNRIRGRAQHEELLKVDFLPFLESNSSLLSGECAGGWQKVSDSCLIYVGARLSYHEAKEFCDKERATLPLLRANHYELSDFLKTQERYFEPRIHRIWIRSFDVYSDECPALNNYRTRNYNCEELNQFLCERDPHVVVSLIYWQGEIEGILALTLALLTVLLTLLCTACWIYKSKERQKEHFQRKNSIRSSLRSARVTNTGSGKKISSYASNNSLSDLILLRQMYGNGDKNSVTDLSLSSSQLTPQTVAPNANVNANLIRFDPSATAPIYSPGGQNRGYIRSLNQTPNLADYSDSNFDSSTNQSSASYSIGDHYNQHNEHLLSPPQQDLTRNSFFYNVRDAVVKSASNSSLKMSTPTYLEQKPNMNPDPIRVRSGQSNGSLQSFKDELYVNGMRKTGATNVRANLPKNRTSTFDSFPQPRLEFQAQSKYQPQVERSFHDDYQINSNIPSATTANDVNTFHQYSSNQEDENAAYKIVDRKRLDSIYSSKPLIPAGESAYSDSTIYSFRQQTTNQAKQYKPRYMQDEASSKRSFIETSLDTDLNEIDDQDEYRLAPASLPLFDGSQRLSPASSSAFDSKFGGSRVYLETSLDEG